MKTSILSGVMIALLFVTGLQLNAQDKKYPEPDLDGKIYYFDQAENKTVEMEYGVINETFRSAKGGEEQILEYSKEKSMVRVKNADKICFLIKMNSEEGADLAASYKLLKLTVNPKTKKREIVTEKRENWSGNIIPKLIKVPFMAKKVVVNKDKFDNIVLIVGMITVSNIQPGEYVFYYPGTSEGSFFGVD